MKSSRCVFLCLVLVWLMPLKAEAQTNKAWADSVKVQLPGTWVVTKTTMNGRVRREFNYTGNQMIFTAREVFYVGSEKDTSFGEWQLSKDSMLMVTEDKGLSKDYFKIIALKGENLILERKSKGGNVFRYTMVRRRD